MTTCELDRQGVKLSQRVSELKNYLRQEIITSDGTTLLGAGETRLEYARYCFSL